MFNKKSIICILMLLFILVVSLGVSSAADYGINDLEVNDNTTDLNVTLTSSYQNSNDVLDEQDQIMEESQVSDSDSDDIVEDTSHSHSTLSSIQQAPVSYVLSPIYDLVTSVNVLRQDSNYLNYTIMVLDNSTVTATGVSVSITFSSTDLQVINNGGAVVSGNTITWNIGTITGGENATLKLQFKVLNNATVNVTANATSSVGEVDLSNNYAENILDVVTFRRLTDLQTLIDGWSSSYALELTDNYAYDYLDADDVANFNTYTGVLINKTISISNNYFFNPIISGAGKVKIFNITSDANDVSLSGLIFLSGRSNRGAAITDYGNGLKVINCTFDGNVVDGDYGGAIFIGANDSQIVSSIFNNNNVSQSGGAIGTDGAHNVIIRNNTFTNNYVPSTQKFGGALGFINSDGIHANFNVFMDNRAREGLGSAIYSESVTNYNISDNWFGKNEPDWGSLVYGNLPTSWIVLRYEITAGYVSTADTRASWYSYNNITKTYTKLTTQLPERNITFDTNNTASLPGGVLNPDRNTILDEVNVAYWYPPYTSLFYMNATVDNQTVDLIWNTVLNITKTVDRNVSVAGDDVYFNLTVINWGPNVAYNVTVREFVPSGFAMVNASVNGDSFSQIGGAFVYLIPSIGPGSNYTIPIIMKTTTNGTFTNRMNVTKGDYFNWFVETDSYVNHTAIPGVDLRIEVTNASTYVTAPYDIYVTIRNLGPCVAYNVTAYFMIPQNFTFVSGPHWHSYSGLSNWGNYDPTTGIWTNINSLNPGGYATMRLRTSPTTLGYFNTTANVTSDVNETKLANNYLNLTYYVTDNTDLALFVTPRVNGVYNTTPYYKSTVVLEYYLQNYGPAPAIDVAVNITLPAGLKYESNYGATGGSYYNTTTSTWVIGDLPSVGSSTYRRIYIVCTADEVGNWTIYSNASGTRNDTNLSNNYVETNITIDAYADLRIYLTANESYPSYDSTNIRNFTYTIKIFNAGLNNATDVNVSFSIPTGLVYLDHTTGVIYNPTTGIWTVGNLLVNETQEVNITVGVNTTGNITAHANITGFEIDPWKNNNYVNLTVRARNLAELIIDVKTNLTTIWNGTDNIYEGNDGDNVTYTITVTNLGPMDAIDVNITHYLYDLTYLDCNASGTYHLYGRYIIWNIGNLTAGSSAVVHFNATISKPIDDYVVNNGTVTSDSNEVNETNNTFTTIAHILHFVDLDINITISNDTPAFHDLIYLNVTVINHGPSIAVNTTVNITLPLGLTYVTSSSSSYNPTTGIWTIGLLNNTAPNNITKLTITLNVTDIGPMNISAFVNNSVNETNPPNNNMTINLTSHPSADLIVTITDNIVGDINMGKDFLVFVNVTNKGPSNATNVNVTITIPSGLATLNDNSSGAYNNLTGIWNIGNLPAGQTRILQINVTSYYATTYVLIANVTGNESDPVSTNNIDNDTITITPVFDLRINVTATRFKTPVNESIIFTVTLYNAGPCNATNIVVSGLFDPSFTVLPATWTYSNLHPGDSISFNVTVIPTELGLFTSYFNVTAYGCDTNMSNNYINVPINVTYLIDLLITVTVDNATPYVGGNVSYLITVSNKLPSDAHDTYVYLPIPTSNLTYIEHFLASGSYDPTTGIWNIGTLGGGNSTSLLLTTQVLTYGVTNLTGTVDAAEFDNYTLDNEDSALINAVNGSLPGTVDLNLILTVNDTTPNVGDYVTFTANLTNIGVSNATGVKVNFTIPSGFTDISTSSTFYIGDIWYVGNLKVGESAFLNITAKPILTTNLTITGNASSNEIDSNLTNNVDNATIYPQESSDIVVNITVNNTNPYLDEEIVFTILVTNIGYCNDTGVEVNVTIPPSPFYSYPAGTFFSPATGQWVIGNLNVGETKELNITLNVSSLIVGNYTFNATGNGSIYETNYTNNYDEVNVTIRAPTDIFVDIDANTTLIYSGDSITFVVNVTNIGLGPAEDVFVQLNLPSSVDYITSKGLFDTNKSLWSVGNLSVGETQTLNVTLVINDVGSFLFTANGTTSTLDKDLTNNNDTFNLTVKPGFDLTIKIEVINTTVIRNGEINFTITVNNTGIGTAENVKVDTGIMGAEAFITKGTYSNLTQIWDIGNVTPGEVLILNITYVPTTVGNYTFTTNVSSTEYERNKTNNRANITIEVINAVDLNITITVNNDTPSLGQSVRYNITVTNNGINTATAVNVATNIKGSGVTALPGYVGFLNTMGDLLWYIPSITPGTTYTLQVDAPVTSPGIVVTEVKVNSTEIDLNTTDNYDNVTLNVSTDTDLCVTINVTNTTPYVGEIVNFTIHISNIGYVNATNVEAITNLPPAVTYTLTDGLYNPLNGVWIIDNLPNGTDAYLNVSVNITTLGFQVYNVTVNMTNNDTNWTNNNDTVNLTSVSVVDLDISIIGNTSFFIGNTTTFTILVVNNGPNDATGVNVTFDLPGDSFTPSVTGNLWNIGNLNAGDNATLVITRTIKIGDNGTYFANVSGNEFEFITNNNNATINLTVKPVVDLNISITTPATNYIYGDNVVYTIIVNNNGPCNITGANVTLDLPIGYIRTFNMSSNGAYINGTTWIIGTLNIGMPATLTIMGTINQTGNLTSTATVKSDVYELNDTDNIANWTYNVEAAADLSINMTLIPGIFNPDGTIGFNVTVINLGPTKANNVSVNVSFPISFDYNTTIGYFDSANNVWFIPELDINTPQTLLVNLNLTNFTVTFYSNVSSDILDQDMSNNYANISIDLLPLADLQVTITVNDTTPSLGQNVTFTVNVTNLGPCLANDVFVYVDLPTSINYTASKGLFDTLNGTWEVNTLLPGQSEILEVIVEMNTLGVVTFHTNTTGNVNDTNLINNNDSVTLNVQPVTDIEVIITSNATSIYIGDTVEFNITVINHGTNADNVTTRIGLPSGITLPPTIIFSAPPAGFNMFTYVWDIIGLAGGSNQTATVIATITSNGTFNISASTNGTLHDTNITNNNATLYYNVSSVIDLQINITSTNTTQYVGENVTFTVTVTNIGLHTATNVYVNTTLPKGTSTKTDGIFDSDTGLWYIGIVNPGDIIELNVTVINNITGTVTYDASVKSNEKDANYANNNATITFTGLNSTDLSITVSVNDDHPYLDDTINYTITIKNNGINIAENVQINTTLPSTGFEFIGSDPGYDNTTGIWTIGNINPGDTKVVTFVYKTNVSGTFTSNFTVNTTTYDLDLSNNEANITVIVNNTVRPNNNFVDLIVNLTVDNPTPAINSTIYFNITVYNNASITAHNVTITNFLPAGFINVTQYGNVSAGVWEIDQLAPTTSISIGFYANVTSYGSFVNNVTVESTELDRVPIDNRANVLIVIGSSSVDSVDLGINITRINENLTINGTVTYNITVTNYGPNNVNFANASITFDNGLVIDNYTEEQGTYNPTTGLWSIGNISVNTNVSMTVTLNITRYGYFVSTFSTWSEFVDSNSLNNNVIDIIQVNNTLVDIGIRIKSNTTAPVMNDTINFEVTIYNSGVLTATNVTVNITWPENITDINVTDPAYNNTTNTYYVGNLANGTTVTFTFTAKINTTTPTTIKVSVNSTEEDRYLDNNEDNITVVCRDAGAAYADLVITSFYLVDPADTFGEYLSTPFIRLNVTNKGPDVAHNVYVYLSLPPNCEIKSSTATPGDFKSVTNSTPYLFFDTLPVGRTDAFIDVGFLIGDVNNFIINATIWGDEIDTNPVDNVAAIGISPTVTPPDIDLHVSVTSSKSTIQVNKTVTFFMEVKNIGNNTAYNISLDNLLPPGFEIISTGSADSSLVFNGSGWFINSLMGHGTPVKKFNITAKATIGGVYVFTSNANCTMEDKDPTNNVASVGLYVTVPSGDAKNITTNIAVNPGTLTNGVNQNRSTINHGANYYVNLTRNDTGAGISFQTVTLIINSTTTGYCEVLTAVTDADGIATFNVPSPYMVSNRLKFHNKKCVVTAVFDGVIDGNDNYLASTSNEFKLTPYWTIYP